jgi:beta-lactamase superfamily II metal-dependent hydrolase
LSTAVYCHDVGQANCLSVIDPWPAGGGRGFQAAVVDVGVDGNKFAQWLRASGVRYIPLIVLTHNDEDHVFGLSDLVRTFQGQIGQILFVVDRDSEDIPYWLDSQHWADQSVIGSVDVLSTPKSAKPSMGRVLLSPPNASYSLHCVYPDIFQNAAAVQRAAKAGARTGHGPNETSGVLGLALPGSAGASPQKFAVLFGGDLDYHGWHCLVESGHVTAANVLIAPHHGAPKNATKAFGPRELAMAVQPDTVVFSAGTRQRHVRAGSERTARHPHEDFVRGFRAVKSNVLCTQLTRRCVDDPESFPARAVLPRSPLLPAIDLHPSGTACAGTIVLKFSGSGQVTVDRLGEHQMAVNNLAAPAHPICRP